MMSLMISVDGDQADQCLPSVCGTAGDSHLGEKPAVHGELEGARFIPRSSTRGHACIAAVFTLH